MAALVSRPSLLLRPCFLRGALPAVSRRAVSTSRPLFQTDKKAEDPKEDEFDEEYEEGVSSGKGRAALLALFMCGGGYGYYSWDEQSMKDVDVEISENEVLLELQKAGSLYIWAFAKMRQKINNFFLYFADPPKPKLLPDLPSPAHQPVLTVVLDLEDTLVYTEWDRQKGLRPRKRPFTSEFLQRLATAGAEIVIFASGSAMFADGIVQALDPQQQFIHHRLGKEYTLYRDGKHYKDLSRLNRDLSKVVIIDNNPECYELQPENAIPISSWHGDRSDTALKELLPFIEHVMHLRSPDVRKDIQMYKDDPKHFSRKAEAREKKQAKIAGFLGQSVKQQANIPAAADGIVGNLPRVENAPVPEEGEKQGRLWQWLKRRNDQSALKEQQLQEEWMQKMQDQKKK